MSEKIEMRNIKTVLRESVRVNPADVQSYVDRGYQIEKPEEVKKYSAYLERQEIEKNKARRNRREESENEP